MLVAVRHNVHGSRGLQITIYPNQVWGVLVQLFDTYTGAVISMVRPCCEEGKTYRVNESKVCSSVALSEIEDTSSGLPWGWRDGK